MGFEVISRRNADQTTMKRAIQEFGARLEKAGPGAVGLFFYAGHGAQLNGRNYLVPIGARIDRESDLDIEAVSADWVIEQMRYARNSLNLVILDACRNNPFARSSRSGDRGLAVMDAPAGILIAYSTAPGSVAADGDGRNSPYTDALVRSIRTVDEPVEQVFKRTRVAVMNASDGRQIPWEASSLTGDFYFSGPPRRTESGTPAAARPTVALQSARPAVATPAPAAAPSDSWYSGLMSYFKGSDASSSTNPNTIAGASALALSQSLGVQAGLFDGNGRYAPAAVRSTLAQAPRRVTVGSTPEQIRAAFALCRSYSTACRLDWYADEGLRVTTLSPFDMDVAPVSVRAFRQFVETTRYRTEAESAGFAYALDDSGRLKAMPRGSWRNGVSGRPISEDAAVVGVSFQDAVAYCRHVGARLPTEDEWEYAARGPQRRTFPWGEDPGPALTMPEAAPAADAGPGAGLGGRYRGLSGNVWQWVDATVEGRRVLKGGSWLEQNPANKRPAVRRYEISRRADQDSGFRCARSVTEWPDTDQWLAQLQAGALNLHNAAYQSK
jgi:formylglycine-generating enzyme required for sulfatase activity